MDSDGLLKNLSRIKKATINSRILQWSSDSLNSDFDLLRHLIQLYEIIQRTVLVKPSTEKLNISVFMSHDSEPKDVKESGKTQEDKLNLQNMYFLFIDILLPLNNV